VRAAAACPACLRQSSWCPNTSAATRAVTCDRQTPLRSASQTGITPWPRRGVHSQLSQMHLIMRLVFDDARTRPLVLPRCPAITRASSSVRSSSSSLFPKRGARDLACPSGTDDLRLIRSSILSLRSVRLRPSPVNSAPLPPTLASSPQPPPPCDCLPHLPHFAHHLEHMRCPLILHRTGSTRPDGTRPT
jgi:hypothetical protein